MDNFPFYQPRQGHIASPRVTQSGDVGDVVSSRLLTALKHQRKEKKALTQVWSSLKSLNLGP